MRRSASRLFLWGQRNVVTECELTLRQWYANGAVTHIAVCRALLRAEGVDPPLPLETPPLPFPMQQHYVVSLAQLQKRPSRTPTGEPGRICAHDGCITVLCKYNLLDECYAHQPGVSLTPAGHSGRLLLANAVLLDG